MIKTSVVILGAGVAGLAAAAEAERNKVDYLLLESNPVVGGLTRSIYINDYIFDYTGHLLHLNKYSSPEEIGRHFDNNDWVRIDRLAKCMYQDTMIDAPFQYNIIQLPANLYQKHLSSYQEAKIDTKQQSGTLKEYFYKHFGKAISDEFLIPYNEKQFMISTDELSAESISRFFPAPIDNFVISGIKKNPQALYNSQFWYPKHNGIQLLVDCLVKDTDCNRIKVNSPVIRIDLDARLIYTTHDVISYESIVSSIPLNNLVRIVNPKDKDVQATLSGITACSTIAYHIGVNARIPDKFAGIHWIYFSEPKYPFYRVGFYSNFNSNMVSDNKYSIYVEIGSNELHPQITDTSLIVNALHSAGILRPSDIEILSTNIINNSYIHFNFTRTDNLNLIERFCAENKILLIGRYGRWQYSSMEDSIIEGINSMKILLDNR